MLAHGVGGLNIEESRIPGGLGQKNGKPVQGRFPNNVIGEISDYQKFFYCPKISREERHIGFDLTQIPTSTAAMIDPATGVAHNIMDRVGGNNHPTVKPIELMKYLIRLVTPPGGRVLDPFNGSGSTGCAAVELDYEYTGIELNPAYAEIARTRIEGWYNRA
jgi:site-specific DNA-methyltransferase (adenine-specific)